MKIVKESQWARLEHAPISELREMAERINHLLTYKVHKHRLEERWGKFRAEPSSSEVKGVLSRSLIINSHVGLTQVQRSVIQDSFNLAQTKTPVSVEIIDINYDPKSESPTHFCVETYAESRDKPILRAAWLNYTEFFDSCEKEEQRILDAAAEKAREQTKRTTAKQLEHINSLRELAKLKPITHSDNETQKDPSA